MESIKHFFLNLWNRLTAKPVVNDGRDNIHTKEKPPEMDAVLDVWDVPSIDTSSPRKIQKELENILDKQILKTAKSDLFKAIKSSDANTIVGLACEALSQLNIREKTNNNDGRMVELIQKTSGGHQGYAWCMYAVQTAVSYAEKKTGKVSKLYSSGSCASVRAKTPTALQINYKTSSYGDIWIWVHTNGLGHTGNFKNWIKQYSSTSMFEGNTTAGRVGDKIVREGGGYYQTERRVELEKTSNMRLAMVVRAF